MVPLAYLDYELRKDYISEVLCINRDIPESNCQGKCYLKKQLAQADGTTDTQNSVNQERLILSFFKENQATYALDSFIPSRLTHQINSIQGIPQNFIQDIYHPPRYNRC